MKVTGYRELTDLEKEYMNDAKAQGNELGALIETIRSIQLNNDSISDDEMVEIEGYLNNAEVNIKQGMMWLIRALARPTTFC